MLEIMAVDIRHYRGAFGENNVVDGIVRFSFQDLNGQAKITLGSTEFTVSPLDPPPFMELKTTAPPYIVEGHVKGSSVNVQPGDAEVEAVLWVLDAEKLAKVLPEMNGAYTLADLLGAISTEIKNLTPIPAIVRTGW